MEITPFFALDDIEFALENRNKFSKSELDVITGSLKAHERYHRAEIHDLFANGTDAIGSQLPTAQKDRFNAAMSMMQDQDEARARFANTRYFADIHGMNLEKARILYLQMLKREYPGQNSKQAYGAIRKKLFPKYKGPIAFRSPLGQTIEGSPVPDPGELPLKEQAKLGFRESFGGFGARSANYMYGVWEGFIKDLPFTALLPSGLLTLENYEYLTRRTPEQEQRVKDMANALNAQVQEYSANFERWSWQGITTNIITAGLDMIPVLGAAYVTGGSNMMAILPIAAQAGGSAYNEYRAAGVNHNDAKIIAAFHAAAEGLPELVSLKIILNSGGRSFFRQIIRSAGAEATQEGITGLMQNALYMASINPEMTWKEYVSSSAYDAVIGAGLGATISGGIETVRLSEKKLRQEIETENQRRIAELKMEKLTPEERKALEKGELYMEVPGPELTEEELQMSINEPKEFSDKFIKPLEEKITAINPDALPDADENLTGQALLNRYDTLQAVLEDLEAKSEPETLPELPEFTEQEQTYLAEQVEYEGEQMTREDVIDALLDEDTSETEIAKHVEILEEIPKPKERPWGVMSEEELRKTIDRLKSKFTRLYAFPGPAFDPEVWADTTKLGIHVFASGVRQISAWKDRMISEIGETIAPHLNQLWDEIKSQRNNVLKAEKTVGKIKALPTAIKLKETKALIRKQVERRTILQIPELRALEIKLRTESKAFARGERIGRIETRNKINAELKRKAADIKNIKDSILAYAKENLTKFDRNRVAVMASRAKTQKAMAKVMSRIDAMEEKYQRNLAIEKLKKSVKKLDLSKMRPEYRNAIKEIVDSIDLVRRSEKTIKRLQSMADYIEGNPDHSIPPEQIARLRVLDRIPIDKLSTEDVQLIDAAIGHWVGLNNLKGKLILKGRIREFSRVLEDALVAINKKDVSQMKSDDDLKPGFVKKWLFREQLSMRTTAAILDKSMDGPIKKVLVDNFDHAHLNMREFWYKALDFLNARTKGINVEQMSEANTLKRNWKKIKYSSFKLDSGKTLEITPAQKISMYILSLNRNGYRHLVEGGIRLPRKLAQGLYALTEADVNKITESLTPEERKVAAAIYEYLNTIQKDDINKISLRLLNFEIAIEPHYFPIWTCKMDIRNDYLAKGKETPSSMRQFADAMLETLGIFTKRTGSSAPIMLEDAFSAVTRVTNQAAAYYGYAEALRSAKALVYNQQFQEAMIEKYGEDSFNYLKKHIRAIENDLVRIPRVDEMAVDIINRLDIAILGLHPFIAMKQPMSLALAATEIGEKYITKALLNPSPLKEMVDNSVIIRHRAEGNISQELGEHASVGMTRSFWTGKHAVSQKLLAAMKYLDMQAISRIWSAVKYETTELHPELSGNQFMRHVARRAEEIINITQPTYDVKERSGFTKEKTAFSRLMTKFSTQRNKNYNMMVRQVLKYQYGNKGSKAKLKFAKSLFVLTVVNALAMSMVDDMRDFLSGKKTLDQLRMARFTSYLETMLSNVYFVSDIARSIFSHIDRGIWRGYDTKNIIQSWAEGGIDGVAQIVKGAQQLESGEKYKSGDRRGEKKWSDSMTKGADNLAELVLHYKGLPYANAKRLLEMVWHWIPEAENKEIKK